MVLFYNDILQEEAANAPIREAGRYKTIAFSHYF